MDNQKYINKKIRNIAIIVLIALLITLLFYMIGFCPILGKVMAKNKIKKYLINNGKYNDEIIAVEYDWYNGKYSVKLDGDFRFDYQLNNNSIFDNELHNHVDVNFTKAYKNIKEQFPSNITFPEGALIWTTINANNYDILAQRLYILEIYNIDDITIEESKRMPAQLGEDFIKLLGKDYNITGIQLVYGDRNGLYEIAIAADSYKELDYGKMLKATEERSGKDLPLSYHKWLEESGF